jgi:hypothetical protein
MLIEASSQEYILVPLTGPDGVDLTTLPVSLALRPDGGQDPVAWVAAQWIGGQAGLLIHPGDYPNGEYMVWWKLTSGAEVPTGKSGRVRIGDSRS